MLKGIDTRKKHVIMMYRYTDAYNTDRSCKQKKGNPSMKKNPSRLYSRTYKLTAADLAKLKAMAENGAGGNRSYVIRQLIRKAPEPGSPSTKKRRSPTPSLSSSDSISTTLN